jgi:hypothetical protein
MRINYILLTDLFYSLYFLFILISLGEGVVLPYGICSVRHTVFSVSHVGFVILCVSHPKFFLFLGLVFAHLKTGAFNLLKLVVIVKSGED